MMASSLLSTLHLLALAIGLPGVFLRGRWLRRVDPASPQTVARVLTADAVWGVAAALWLATGLTRAFGPFEKGSAYYLHSSTFLLKMGCFVVIVLLELLPMLTLIGWRRALARGQPPALGRAPLLVRLNDAELALTLAMPFLASMMARGVGA